MSRVRERFTSTFKDASLSVLSYALAIPWLAGMIWCAASPRFVLWEKIVYTTLIAFIPLYFIVCAAIYERIEKRKQASHVEHDAPKEV